MPLTVTESGTFGSSELVYFGGFARHALEWSFGVGVLEEDVSTAVIYLLILTLCRGMAVPLQCLQDKDPITRQCAGGIWTRYWDCLPRAEGISLALGDASGSPG